MLTIGVSFAVGRSTSPDAAPTNTSVEAGFARDMAVHHSQAVDMAERIRKRSSDEMLGYLTADIVLTQQAQIGQMGAWLDLWGLTRVSVGQRAMAWSGMSMSGEMPGMASRVQINLLDTLPVDQAEVRFLQLMIAHHKGGVHMAQMALALHPNDTVARLARSIVTAQQSEITAMTGMLKDRGAKP
ncbi:MAG: DUF305 domain-containing protein [Acidimicrobiales bacterium]